MMHRVTLRRCAATSRPCILGSQAVHWSSKSEPARKMSKKRTSQIFLSSEKVPWRRGVHVAWWRRILVNFMKWIVYKFRFHRDGWVNKKVDMCVGVSVGVRACMHVTWFLQMNLAHPLEKGERARKRKRWRERQRETKRQRETWYLLVSFFLSSPHLHLAGHAWALFLLFLGV